MGGERGVADGCAAEEVGSEAYPEEHCTACFDTCGGAVPNGTMVCAGHLVEGDGRGNPDNATFECTAGEAPDGFVSNAADCDDSAYGATGDLPAAVEVCDGVDNDCDGMVDDGIAEVGAACATGLDGSEGEDGVAEGILSPE